MEFKKDSEQVFGKNSEIKITRRPHKSARRPKRNKFNAPASSESKNVCIPPKSVIFLLLVAVIVSLLLGCITRICINSKGLKQHLEKPQYGRAMPATTENNQIPNDGDIELMLGNIHKNNVLGTKVMKLPSPQLLNGKTTPKSTYTYKTFQAVSVAAATSNTIHLEKDSSSQHKKSMTRKGWRDSNESVLNAELLLIDDNNDEVHLPSGQHLVSNISQPTFIVEKETHHF
jgi:hypothetical protein